MSNLSITYSFERTTPQNTHQTDSRFIRTVVMLMTLSIATAILVPHFMHLQMVNEETTVIGITTAIQRRMNGEMAKWRNGDGDFAWHELPRAPQ